MDIAENRRAYFDYEILETYEAGIELLGFEVKSAKKGRLQLTGSFAIIRNDQAFLLHATITPLQPKNVPPGHDPERTRRLLLHRAEIKELIGKSMRQGLTIVPLKVYSKKNRIKILLGIGRHKKKTDKRETLKKRDTEREIDREMKRE